MSKSLVEQSDLEPGYTLIESTHYILGKGTTRNVAIRGGTHPKMELLVAAVNTELLDGDHFSGDFSFALSRLSTTGTGVFCVTHRDGTIAGQTAAETDINEIFPFAAIAGSAIQKVGAVFEADEDVLLAASTENGNAADSVLVILKFKVVN